MQRVIDMEKKILVRYLILVTVLVICAGAAWMISEMPGKPQGDAVLAWSDSLEDVQEDDSEAEENVMRTQYGEKEAAGDEQ